jgi:Protein of unknown function (DUF3105)
MRLVRISRLAWWLATVGVLLSLVGLEAHRQAPLLKGSLLGSWAQSKPAPCLPGRAIPIMASPHLSVAALRHVRYDSNPPTSGPHFAIPPAPGIYDSPLPAGEFIHAEEHGHVVIAYAPGTPASQVSVLKAIAKQFPGEVVMTPYLGISHGIALAAWGRLQRLDNADPDAVTGFVIALAGRYDHTWVRADPCG